MISYIKLENHLWKLKRMQPNIKPFNVTISYINKELQLISNNDSLFFSLTFFRLYLFN